MQYIAAGLVGILMLVLAVSRVHKLLSNSTVGFNTELASEAEVSRLRDLARRQRQYAAEQERQRNYSAYMMASNEVAGLEAMADAMERYLLDHKSVSRQ